MRAAMDESDVIEVSGRLEREAGGFVLSGDDGIRYRLELVRTPVDLVAKRARVMGALREGGLISVDGIGPA